MYLKVCTLCGSKEVVNTIEVPNVTAVYSCQALSCQEYVTTVLRILCEENNIITEKAA